MKSEHFKALYSKYPAGQYAMLKEVRDAAGHYANRSCDIMAMGLWPSRGLELHGIEVKSIRSDWLKELKVPEKQESIFQHCDRFWLYATNEDVAFEKEIPKNWGYMLFNGKKLVVKKEAPLLKSKPMSRTMLASMLKNATERLIHKETIEDKLLVEFERGKESRQFELEKELKQLRPINKTVEEFKAAVGMDLAQIANCYHSDGYIKSLGDAVNIILDGKNNIKEYALDLNRIKTILTNNLKSVEDDLSTFEKIEDKPRDDWQSKNRLDSKTKQDA